MCDAQELILANQYRIYDFFVVCTKRKMFKVEPKLNPWKILMENLEEIRLFVKTLSNEN